MRHDIVTRCVCFICLSFVSLLGIRRALGAEGDDGAPRKLLSLTNVDAYLEFRGGYNYHRVETKLRSGFPRDTAQRNREWTMQQRLGLRLGGVFIDPSFITFQADLAFGLSQSRFEERLDGSSMSDRDNGYLLQYDLRLNLFRGRPISGSLYGLRQDDRINRRFQPTLDQQRTGFGTSWSYSRGNVRMDLSYDYLETDRTGNADRDDDEHFTDSTLRYRLEWQVSKRTRIDFTYEHSNSKQEYQGLDVPFETTRDLFTIDHETRFGDELQHELRTRIHWQEESGDFARDFFEIGPRLTLRHSDTLQTLYQYQFNRQRYDGLDIETQRLDFQVVHQLYSNLTTTLDLFALYEDVEDDINTTQYGASVDFQYNRRNPYGHLYANFALAYDTEEVDGDNGKRLILDESQTFRDPVAVTLRNRNVIVTSIVVSDAANTRIFLLGTDYVIFQQGNVARLTRLRTGRIADGDVVLVDYLIRSPARGQLDTLRVDFSVEQRFTGGLTPYYRLSYRNQEDDITTGFLRRADRTNHHRVGANYEQPRYTLGMEYEIFDDTVEPFDAFHLSGLYHIVRDADRTVDATARFSRMFFEGGLDSRNVTLIDLELDHRRRLTDAWSTIERLAFRYEDDSSDGITQAWDVSAGLEYAVGDLSGELTLEYDRLDLPHSEENNFGFYFRLRRELPNVLGR